jgi:hypothetical protein
VTQLKGNTMNKELFISKSKYLESYSSVIYNNKVNDIRLNCYDEIKEVRKNISDTIGISTEMNNILILLENSLIGMIYDRMGDKANERK